MSVSIVSRVTQFPEIRDVYGIIQRYNPDYKLATQKTTRSRKSDPSRDVDPTCDPR